jgi:hypothetical protein
VSRKASPPDRHPHPRPCRSDRNRIVRVTQVSTKVQTMQTTQERATGIRSPGATLLFIRIAWRNDFVGYFARRHISMTGISVSSRTSALTKAAWAAASRARRRSWCTTSAVRAARNTGGPAGHDRPDRPDRVAGRCRDRRKICLKHACRRVRCEREGRPVGVRGQAEAPLTAALTIGLMDGGRARECFAADFGDERSVKW